MWKGHAYQQQQGFYQVHLYFTCTYCLKFVASSDESKFMICSDSLSCLAIESCKTQNPFISNINELDKSLVAVGKHVLFTEYLSVVSYYLVDSYVLIYYVLYDICSILLVPSDFD
jgi:hypothetical protein